MASTTVHPQTRPGMSGQDQIRGRNQYFQPARCLVPAVRLRTARPTHHTIQAARTTPTGAGNSCPPPPQRGRTWSHPRTCGGGPRLVLPQRAREARHSGQPSGLGAPRLGHDAARQHGMLWSPVGTDNIGPGRSAAEVRFGTGEGTAAELAGLTRLPFPGPRIAGIHPACGHGGLVGSELAATTVRADLPIFNGPVDARV